MKSLSILWGRKSLKEKILRSITLLTLVGVCLSVAAWVVASARKQEPKNTDNARPKTLRERALAGDVEFDMLEGHFDKEYGDLRWLAKHSDAIVLGRILEEESYFSGDQNITTRYKVEVQRVIKDERPEAGRLSQSLGKSFPAPLTTPLSFTRFGGSVQVNGHRASVRVKGSELLTSNKTYVLFLQWTGHNYHIAGGMSGVVLVQDSLRVNPLGTNPSLKRKHYERLHLEAVIEEVLKELTN
ncbi:MAG TPA: hypothetical protein VFH31_14870 [Pyrinomonadaceae bacterium]|nr:hypothetical protein [Pyrinomonadaceae bacterium]